MGDDKVLEAMGLAEATVAVDQKVAKPKMRPRSPKLHFRYIVVPTGDVTEKLINSSTSRTALEARRSLDNSQTVLELSHPIQEWLLDYKQYTLNDILALMATAEWAEPTEDK